MTLPSVRFTLRGMVVDISRITLVLVVCILIVRWADSSAKLNYYRASERAYRRLARDAPEWDVSRAVVYRRRADHATRMREKHRYAIWNPWLSVAPDPAEPEWVDHNAPPSRVASPLEPPPERRTSVEKSVSV